ncbi:MAG: cytochrome c [Pacificibacter sp.]|jgi:mono/diheme cytochrome c family protein|uniref:c-type cytochrome n=1 Tax=Pacificibacter sp. TaxID=1917866 RepID=UPI00321A1392
MKSTIAIAAVLATGLLGIMIWKTPETIIEDVQSQDSNSAGAFLDVFEPELSSNAQIGKQGYEIKCAACHGANAAGQDGLAPPLVHIIYEPNHHGDEAFQRAAAIGVRAHHWPFGDMPPVEGVTRGDVTMIIAYIRELQRANGIN